MGCGASAMKYVEAEVGKVLQAKAKAKSAPSPQAREQARRAEELKAKQNEGLNADFSSADAARDAKKQAAQAAKKESAQCASAVPASQQQAPKDGKKAEKVVRERLVRGKPQYQIKWVGKDSKDNTWEYIENLGDCDEVIAEFKAAKAEEERKTAVEGAARLASLAKTEAFVDAEIAKIEEENRKWDAEKPQRVAAAKAAKEAADKAEKDAQAAEELARKTDAEAAAKHAEAIKVSLKVGDFVELKTACTHYSNACHHGSFDWDKWDKDCWITKDKWDRDCRSRVRFRLITKEGKPLPPCKGMIGKVLKFSGEKPSPDDALVDFGPIVGHAWIFGTCVGGTTKPTDTEPKGHELKPRFSKQNSENLEIVREQELGLSVAKQLEMKNWLGLNAHDREEPAFDRAQCPRCGHGSKSKAMAEGCIVEARADGRQRKCGATWPKYEGTWPWP